MVPASWAFQAAGLFGWSSAKQKACNRHPLSPGERARVRAVVKTNFAVLPPFPHPSSSILLPSEGRRRLEGGADAVLLPSPLGGERAGVRGAS
jgi:hypothetical protein